MLLDFLQFAQHTLYRYSLARWTRDLARVAVFAVVGTAQLMPIQFKHVSYPAGLRDKARFFFDPLLDCFVSVHEAEVYLILQFGETQSGNNPRQLRLRAER